MTYVYCEGCGTRTESRLPGAREIDRTWIWCALERPFIDVAREPQLSRRHGDELKDARLNLHEVDDQSGGSGCVDEDEYETEGCGDTKMGPLLSSERVSPRLNHSCVHARKSSCSR